MLAEDADDDEARSGGSGRKLQLLAGLAATSVKISERRRCWTAVSYAEESLTVRLCEYGKEEEDVSRYQLRVEFGQARLSIVVEHEHRIDHYCCGDDVGQWQRRQRERDSNAEGELGVPASGIVRPGTIRAKISAPPTTTTRLQLFSFPDDNHSRQRRISTSLRLLRHPPQNGPSNCMYLAILPANALNGSSA